MVWVPKQSAVDLVTFFTQSMDNPAVFRRATGNKSAFAMLAPVLPGAIAYEKKLPGERLFWQPAGDYGLAGNSI